jgi:hypothetical protein
MLVVVAAVAVCRRHRYCSLRYRSLCLNIVAATLALSLQRFVVDLHQEVVNRAQIGDEGAGEDARTHALVMMHAAAVHDQRPQHVREVRRVLRYACAVSHGVCYEALAELPRQWALARTAVELHGCCARVSLAAALLNQHIDGVTRAGSAGTKSRSRARSLVLLTVLAPVVENRTVQGSAPLPLRSARARRRSELGNRRDRYASGSSAHRPWRSGRRLHLPTSSVSAVQLMERSLFPVLRGRTSPYHNGA